MKPPAQLLAVTQSLKQCIHHIERQAEKGTKISLDDTTTDPAAPFELYLNECMVGTNTLLFDTENEHVSILNHSLLGFLITTNKEFNEMQQNHFEIVKSLSTSLNVDKKARKSLFRSLKKRVQQLEKE